MQCQRTGTWKVALLSRRRPESLQVDGPGILVPVLGAPELVTDVMVATLSFLKMTAFVDFRVCLSLNK